MRNSQPIDCPVCGLIDLPHGALTCPLCHAELPRPVRASIPWIPITSAAYFGLVLLILAGPTRGAFAPFLTFFLLVTLVIGAVLISHSVRSFLQRRRELRSLAIQREICARIRQ